MAKIQLTIKTSYLPNWGAYEGVRELVQNGRDAEVEHSAPLTVDWYNDTLRIENNGTTVPVKALLLGHTIKLGNSGLIGKFGEGLKLGILALVRAGHPVKIRNGADVWIPSIERSETFDEDVLTFNITGGREQKNRIRVEVGGITKDAWEQMKECFLFLSKPQNGECVDTGSGSLLLGQKYTGRIYVKGIFVQVDPEAQFGYDLKDAEVDRDRKMVEAWNLKYHTRNIFLAAINKREDLFQQFDDLLQDPTTEVESLQDVHTAAGVPEKAIEFVTAKFLERHGANAVPVQTLSESKDIEHLGKKGIMVSKQLGAVLAKKLGDAFTIKSKLSKEETSRYGWSDLSDVEKTILSEAVGLINEVETLGLDNIEVVDFRDEKIMGQLKDGRILLARKHLTDPDETLATLVHEVAHRQGSDGEMGHVRRIETIWMVIVRNLRRKRSN